MQTNTYQDRLNRVCDYIHGHLDGDLSVERLSQVARFSKYHFHRQFGAYMGYPLKPGQNQAFAAQSCIMS
ncbi:helix-turn-helix transcriptional regulator [Methylomonas paludis]|uniref:Helix-turn-helix transcriptional regulator n=1 Tax=Methylomonas paludis TaxID=1173101 RepID=A0A975MQH4_9GAMM|nr:hypothetical protein [Methylomonas paludis]QWF72136.1 helix-turn-helix transcriptional regulator [Methylomonas paludis]